MTPVVLDNLDYGHSSAVKWGELIVGHIQDSRAVEKIVEKHQISSVMHFAAYANVEESVKNPQKYYQNNLIASIAFLDTLIKCGIKKFIFSSSYAVYGIPRGEILSEDEEPRPINPYGQSKLMVEQVLESYHQAYGLDYISLRYSNVAGADPDREIGEEHHPETHLIPLVLAAIENRAPPIKIFGLDYPTPDGSAIRDYIHVNDLAHAHIAADNYLSQKKAGLCLNLGTAKGYSVLEIIAMAEKITGKSCPREFSERRAGDPPSLVASAEKAQQILGWRPRESSLEHIMRTAYQWYCR